MKINFHRASGFEAKKASNFELEAHGHGGGEEENEDENMVVVVAQNENGRRVCRKF